MVTIGPASHRLKQAKTTMVLPPPPQGKLTMATPATAAALRTRYMPLSGPYGRAGATAAATLRRWISGAIELPYGLDLPALNSDAGGRTWLMRWWRPAVYGKENTGRKFYDQRDIGAMMSDYALAPQAWHAERRKARH